MVHLIVGKKGKGKTKELLDRANTAIKEAKGNIVYLDKSSKHMYDLNNRIRLIDVSAFPLTDCDEFIGFICGIISQDRDVEVMYLDSFLKLARLEDRPECIADPIGQLDKISNQFKVDFIISLSLDQTELPETLQDKIMLAM